MQNLSINQDLERNNPPQKTPIARILKQAAQDSFPMIGCSLVGMAADFMAALLVYQTLGSIACVAYAFFNGVLEWPLSGFSVGLTTTTGHISKTAAECEEECIRQTEEGIEAPEANWEKIGSHMHHGIYAALIYSAVFCSILVFAIEAIAKQFGCKEDSIPSVTEYGKIYAIGVPFYFLSYLGNEYCYAIRKRLPVAAVQAAAGLIGIGSGYAIMHGSEGDDHEKLMGMAWGMTIRYITAFLGYALYFGLTQRQQTIQALNLKVNFGLFQRHSFDWAHFKNILGNGLLTQIFVLVEVCVISVMTILASQGQDENIEATQIATQFLSLGIVPLFVTAGAANIQGSDALGRDRPQDIGRIGTVLTLMGIASQLAFLALFLSFPNQLIGLFRKSAVDEMDLVGKLSYTAIIGMIIAQPADAARLILGGTLRGMQNYDVSCLSSALILLPVTYFVGKATSYEGPHWGLTGIVGSRDGAIILAGLIVTLWFYRAAKKVVKNEEVSLAHALSSTGIFRLCNKNNDVERHDYLHNEATSLLGSHEQTVDHDRRHHRHYPVINLSSQFAVPLSNRL